MTLDEIWEVGTRPDLEQFYGKFNVGILSGIFRILNFRYKSWYKDIGLTFGKNIRNGKKEGYFYKHYTSEKCILDYDLSDNNVTWNRLNDHVKQLTPDYFIGKIYFKLWGKYRFMGYFSLTRVKTTDPLMLTNVIL
jgi:hypothetical protein